MPQPNFPENEKQRLAALHRYDLLDSERERAYDDIVAIAAGVCDVPIAAIALIDAERQWFKSRIGIVESQTARAESFSTHAILNPDSLMVINDATRDYRFRDNPLVTADDGIRFYAGAPLVDGAGMALGALCVADHDPRELQPFQRDTLTGLARQASALIELRLAYGELRRHLSEREWFEQELQRRGSLVPLQPSTDALTGLANRRALDEELMRAIERARMTSKPMWLALLDIDGFRTVNDRLGHPAGDSCLIEIARSLQKRLPRFAARCGGDEFAIAFEDTDGASAYEQCEMLRGTIAQSCGDLATTASIGLVSLRTDDGIDELIGRANKALLRAKAVGRDRIVID